VDVDSTTEVVSPETVSDNAAVTIEGEGDKQEEDETDCEEVDDAAKIDETEVELVEDEEFEFETASDEPVEEDEAEDEIGVGAEGW
jgi:hypothetical protein